MSCVFFFNPFLHSTEKPRTGGAERSEVFMIGESPRGCPPVMICQPLEGNKARAKEFTSFTIRIKLNQRPEAECTLTRQRG